MITDIWLIGIGAGSPAHITQEGLDALRNAAIVLMPDKGEEKTDLQKVRRDIIALSGSRAEVVVFDYPVRDPNLPYQDRVARWHDEIARCWQHALPHSVNGPVALLVWGDPSLYDSTLRIAERLSPRPKIRVVAGITALQALTAAHCIPFNTVGGAVQVTTGAQPARIGVAGWRRPRCRHVGRAGGFHTSFAAAPLCLVGRLSGDGSTDPDARRSV